MRNLGVCAPLLEIYRRFRLIVDLRVGNEEETRVMLARWLLKGCPDLGSIVAKREYVRAMRRWN